MENSNTKPVVIFVTHRTYDNGKEKRAGIDQLMQALPDTKMYLIEHPLESDYDISYLKSVQKKERTIIKQIIPWPKKAPLRWIAEAIYNFFWCRQLIKKNQASIIVAVDPLNCISLIPLKWFYRHIRVYSYVVDYSETRFDNYFFDAVYRCMNALSLRFSDTLIVVSKRMADFFTKKYHKNVYYLPNSPIIRESLLVPAKQKNKHSLIFCAGRLTERVNMEGICDVVSELKKSYPAILLHLIGKSNHYVEQLIRQRQIEKNIIVHDVVTHEENLFLIAQSYIGISWYTGAVSHLFWGDSLKIREYASLGLPIVSDGLTCTSEEMKKNGAGYCITTVEEMVNRIQEFIEYTDTYEQMRQCALEWTRSVNTYKLQTVNSLFYEYTI